MNDDNLKKDGEIENLTSSLEAALEETDDIVFEENTEVTGADFQKKYNREVLWKVKNFVDKAWDSERKAWVGLG